LLFKIVKTASQMCEKFKPSFGDNIMGKTQTFEWVLQYKCGEFYMGIQVTSLFSKYT
jgi:hypothetical protein